jgi:TnpA family transposase
MNTTNHIGFGAVMASLILGLIFLCLMMHEASLICLGGVVISSFLYNYKRTEQEKRKENELESSDEYRHN